MRRRRDPRRPVHIHSHVAVLGPHRLAGMQSHPDPHRNAAGPGAASQSTLRVGGQLELETEILKAAAACVGGNAWLLPGEHRLLVVRYPGSQAMQGHLAELVNDRPGRRIHPSVQQR